MKLFVAVDLGATNVRVAYGDRMGFKERASEPTDKKNGAEGVSSQIIRMINSLGVEKIEGISIGSIGPIDLATGCIVESPNIPFKSVPIVEPISDALKVSVALFNDCSAAVFGECMFGAGRGLKNVVYITLSTGLGGGAVIDGRLLLGKDGNAVEVGHITIDPESPLVCGCGCKGHWEAYCSGRNIPNFARLIIGEGGVEGELMSEISDGDLSKITAENLFEAAYRGDRTARHVVSRIGEVNAVGFANVVNVFDPELLTVGGSIAIKNQGLVLKPILENIESHLINRCPEIMITPLGLDAVLYGALALALKKASDGERA